MTDTRPHDAPLRLEAFGTPRLLRAGRALRLGSRKAMAVVLVLALDGAQARETLAALLWPDVDAAAARRNLRRELFRLRTFELRIAERDDGAVELAVAPALALDVDEGQALQGLDGLAGEHFEAWLQRARMRLMRGLVQEFNVFRWAGRMLIDAAGMRSRSRLFQRSVVPGRTRGPGADQPGAGA